MPVTRSPSVTASEPISARPRVKRHPIDALVARNQITARQYRAAIRYRALWSAASWETPLVATLNDAQRFVRGRDQRLRGSEKIVQARDEILAIAQALGRIGEDVLIEILIREKTTREYALLHELGRDGGLPPLRLTLDALADLLGVQDCG